MVKVNFEKMLPLRSQGFVVGVMLSLAVVIVGYGLVKNIKSSQQQVSAEQVGSSPESGVKSRMAELYDALVAKNYGSDTDVSGLTGNLGTDWGAKWNRIKTAALKPGAGGSGAAPVASGVKRVQRGRYDGINRITYSNTDCSEHSMAEISVQPFNLEKSVLITNVGTGMDGTYSYNRENTVFTAELRSNNKIFAIGGSYSVSDQKTCYVPSFAWQIIEYY